MKTLPDSKKPSSAMAVFVGRLCLLLVLLLFVVALFGDFVAWGILGTPYILSPHFASIEHRVISLGGGIFYLSFFVFGKALDSIRQQQWRPLLVLILVTVAAGVPVAKVCAILIHAIQVKGLVVLTHRKGVVLCLMILPVLACKIKVMASVWALIRPGFEPKPAPRFTIASE